MREKLKSLLERILDEEFDSLTRVNNFRNLEFWDSLKYVNLVVGLQSEFKVNLTKEEIQNLFTVSDIEAVLANRGVK